jgi:putative oxygen-independent coproporphyrinogen III oxidase
MAEKIMVCEKRDRAQGRRVKCAEAPEPAGLYVHVPFCRSKCPYCHFYSTTSLGLIPDWLGAVKKEALLYQGLFSSFDTVYFGGGTPSLLSSAALSDLVEFFQHRFGLSEDCEITLEANPGDLDRETTRELRRTGINRLSLGVQSFSEEDLRFLGRRHRVPDAVQAIEAGRSAGFDNLGMDLIFGLPGQTGSRWQETLIRALSFEPEHISAYQLTPEEETPLGNEAALGRVHLWGEEKSAHYFLETSRILESQGFLHYEVSNFARGEDRISRHNRKYWQQVPYLGLGPSAHSFFKCRRWWNPASLESYLNLLGGRQRPAAGEELLSLDQLRLESLMLGFRNREGVAVDQLRLNPAGRAVLAELEVSQKITRQKNRLIPTPRGYLLADRLPLFFC